MIVLRTLLMMPSAIAFLESVPFSLSLLAIVSWMPVWMMSSVREADANSPSAAAGSAWM